MSVGLYSSASSRFVVNVIANGSTGGPAVTVGSLQILPGTNSARTLMFEFFDTAGVGYLFTLSLSDMAFEVADVFGGKKEAGDKADQGAY